MAEDHITLTVPAKGEYAKTVRMTAAALVSRMGMTYDEVDDVRIAAEEAFVYAADSLGEDEEVTMDFIVGDEAIEIVTTLGDQARFDDEDTERRAAYATFILQSVCDRFEMSSDDRGPCLRVVKAKGVDTDADA
ncbi:MAG: ATP-binding protein [Coriobacteriales bacterium]|nr:ATP-binding protein [Coriobacteriales bacterium]